MRSDVKPLAIDLYCGLGGWTEGLLAEGYDVIGFDIERHVYGEHRYPAQLVLQDVRTLHGRQFKDAVLIVASPPCQEYSYMAMPWTRAKRLAQDYRIGVKDVKQLTALFDACLRIRKESGVPMVIENVKGAQPWVGRSRWNFGSFHLWGDVPALMPMTKSIKNNGGSWFNIAHNTTSGHGQNPIGRKVPGIKLSSVGFNVAAAQRYREHQEHIKQGGDWFSGPLEHCLSRRTGSKSDSRKAASAMIAKIPLVLARHIALSWKPA